MIFNNLKKKTPEKVLAEKTKHLDNFIDRYKLKNLAIFYTL